MILATGNFDLKDGQTVIDIGNIYSKSISKPSVLVFNNNQNFVAGDQIILTNYNVPVVGISFDTLTGSNGNQWIASRVLRYRTKVIYRDSLPGNWAYESKLGVKWDFKSRPDRFDNHLFYTKSCGGAQDSLFFQP